MCLFHTFEAQNVIFPSTHILTISMRDGTTSLFSEIRRISPLSPAVWVSVRAFFNPCSTRDRFKLETNRLQMSLSLKIWSPEGIMPLEMPEKSTVRFVFLSFHFPPSIPRLTPLLGTRRTQHYVRACKGLDKVHKAPSQRTGARFQRRKTLPRFFGLRSRSEP